jgi:hypothetical protein
MSISRDDTVRLILSLSDTESRTTETNEALQRLIRNEQTRFEVETLLQNATRQHAFADLAKYLLQKWYFEYPHLPVLLNFHLSELEMLMTTAISTMRPHISCITYRLVPVESLFGDFQTSGFTIACKSSVLFMPNIYEYQVNFSLISDRESESDDCEIQWDINLTKSAGGEPIQFTGTIKCHVYDGIQLNLISQWTCIDQNTNELDSEENDLNLPTYDVNSLLLCNTNIWMTTTTVPLDKDIYKLPTQESKVIYQDITASDEPLDVVKLELVDWHGEIVPNYSMGLSSRDIVGVKFSEDEAMHLFEITKSKYDYEGYISGLRTQVALYQSQYSEILNDVSTIANFEQETLTATIVQGLGQIDEIISNTPRYEPVDINIAMTDKFVTVNLPYPMIEPVTVTKGGNVPFRGNIYKTTGVPGYNLPTYDVINHINIPPVDELITFKAYDVGEVVVYIVLRITREFNSDEVESEFQSTGIVNADVYNLNVTVGNDAGGPRTRFTAQFGNSTGSHFGGTYNGSIVNVKLMTFFVGHKQAIGPGTVESIYFRGNMHYGFDTKDSFLTGAIPGQFDTSEFGLLYGIFIDWEDSILETFTPTAGQYSLTLPKDVATTLSVYPTSTDRVPVIHAWQFEEATGSILTYSANWTSPYQSGVELTPSPYLLTNYASSHTIDNSTYYMITGTNLRWTDVTGRPEVFSARANTVLLRFELNCSLRMLIPPFYLGLRRSANEYINNQQNMIYSLQIAITDILDRLDTIESQLEQMRYELDKLLASDSFWNVVLEMAINVALGFAGPLVAEVFSKAAKLLGKATGYSRRTLGVTFATAKSNKMMSQDYKTNTLPVDSIVEAQAFNEVILKSMNKSPKDMITATTRPMYNIDNKAQHLDRADKIDLISTMRLGGKNRDADSMSASLLAERNVSKNDRLMPVLETYYRPLEDLPSPIANTLHKYITTKGGVRRKIQNDSMNMTNKLPSHSFLIYTDYEKLVSGKYIMKKTYMGVGEIDVFSRPNGGPGLGIGAITIKYDAHSRTRDGKLTYSLSNWEDHGYTGEQIEEYWTYLFRKTPRPFTATDTLWAQMCDEIDRKTLSSTMMNSTVVPDKFVGEVLYDISKNPPTWNYSKYRANCQDFTMDILNFAKGNGMPTKWDLETQARITQNRVNAIREEFSEAFTLIDNLFNPGNNRRYQRANVNAMKLLEWRTS